MQPHELATTAVALLSPYLPDLVKGTVGELGKKLGGGALDAVKGLWGSLWGRLKDRPAAKDAVDAVAAEPGDSDAQGSLRLQIKKLFTEDPAFAVEVGSLIAKVQAAAGHNVRVGERGVYFGEGSQGNKAATGDDSSVS